MMVLLSCRSKGGNIPQAARVFPNPSLMKNISFRTVSRSFALAALLIFGVKHATAQVIIPAHRTTAWHLAGSAATVSAPELVVSIADFGADNTGVLPCNSAYTAAVASLAGAAGTIHFPEGEYFFNATIALPDSVFLQGQSTATVLRFETPIPADLITITGSISNVALPLALGASRGQYAITLTDAATIAAGDVIRLAMDDDDLVFSSWALGTVGQVVEVTAVEGNTLTLADPLNTYYPMARSLKVFKVTPVRAAGVECLTILRADQADAQVSNISIRAGFNCVVRNVHSTYCGFAHVQLSVSAHVTVEGCYFNQAIGYGSGGRGYGVMLQETSSFNHVRNSIFDRLRHSMIVQSGANGNVFSYNFSRDPYWTDVSLPANSAGDIVMHGNYPFMNLAEGNTAQHIVVDASHGTNGPMNTFFRNRAQLYGFFSDNATVTDSMNLIGNEMTNFGLFMGNFIVTGVGHLNHGNNVRGTVTPAGTQTIGIESLLYPGGNLPAYLGENLPYIGYPLAMNANTTPAHARYTSNTFVSCVPEVVTALEDEASDRDAPFIQGNTLVIPTEMLPAEVFIYGMDGRVHGQFAAQSTRTPIMVLPASIHVVQLRSADGAAFRWKVASGF